MSRELLLPEGEMVRSDADDQSTDATRSSLSRTISREPRLRARPRYNEPTGVKYAKVRCLALLADANTAQAVIAELGEYAVDIDPELARHAIRAVGKICLRLPETAPAAIERLIEFMGMDVSNISTPPTPPKKKKISSVLHMVAQKTRSYS